MIEILIVLAIIIIAGYIAVKIVRWIDNYFELKDENDRIDNYFGLKDDNDRIGR